MKNTGECFCGDVRYEYEGELLDARSCHCSRCRKIFSAQASAYALIESAGFNWICGEEQLLVTTVLVFSFVPNVVQRSAVF